jgi:peptidoglycan/LPS O-acetylase OafA/YrhL
MAIGAALILFLTVKHSAPLAAALLIGLAMPLFRQIPSGFIRTWSERIAKYSFGIYLTHTFCIWLAFTNLAARPLGVRWTIFGLLLVVLPVTFFYAIEQPMIRTGTRLAKKVRDRGRSATPMQIADAASNS